MKKIAELLLKIKAVTLSTDEPFIWASGIKSPIYCDNRLLLSYPKERKEVLHTFADEIICQYPEIEYIMGTATAGIPHAAILADNMKLPMGFVRQKAKDHGKGNQIEGLIKKGAYTLVIEDLISTGGSSIDAALALREAGFNVMGVFSIFTYGMKKADENFAQHGLKYNSLTNYDTLLKVAAEQGYIKEEDVERLLKWRDNPSDESWIKSK